MEPNPQVAPTLLKKALGFALLAGYAACVVVPLFKETMTARRLELLAERVIILETIYDAEAITGDAHRVRPEDGTTTPETSQ